MKTSALRSWLRRERTREHMRQLAGRPLCDYCNGSMENRFVIERRGRFFHAPCYHSSTGVRWLPDQEP